MLLFSGPKGSKPMYSYDLSYTELKNTITPEPAFFSESTLQIIALNTAKSVYSSF